MSAEPLGIGTSSAEITNVTAHGVWLLTGEQELFMPYEHFPWFKDVPQRRRQLVAEIPSLAVSDLAIQVAERLLAKGAIPSGSENDALHIGIAAAQGADYLLTWNFRHISNAETKSAIEKVVESFGFICPEICSPEELARESND